MYSGQALYITLLRFVQVFVYPFLVVYLQLQAETRWEGLQRVGRGSAGSSKEHSSGKSPGSARNARPEVCTGRSTFALLFVLAKHLSYDCKHRRQRSSNSVLPIFFLSSASLQAATKAEPPSENWIITGRLSSSRRITGKNALHC